MKFDPSQYIHLHHQQTEVFMFAHVKTRVNFKQEICIPAIIEDLTKLVYIPKGYIYSP